MSSLIPHSFLILLSPDNTVDKCGSKNKGIQENVQPKIGGMYGKMRMDGVYRQ